MSVLTWAFVAVVKVTFAGIGVMLMRLGYSHGKSNLLSLWQEAGRWKVN